MIIIFSLISRDRLGKFGRLILNYETKVNGRILYGKDLKYLIPDININNLDFKESNEILSYRLWSILLYFPESFFDSKDLSKLNNFFKFIVCRNALDILTWFLPRKGVLLPLYSSRLNYVKKNKDILDESYGRDFYNFIKKCYIVKMDVELKEVPPDYYQNTINYIFDSYKMLMENEDFNEFVHWSELFMHKSKRYYNETPFIRKMYELYLGMRFFTKSGGKNLVKWNNLSKKGAIVCFLINMHEYILKIAQNDLSEQEASLKRAYNALDSLSLFKVDSLREYSKSNDSYWLYLRRQYLKFLIYFYKFYRTKEDYLDYIIGGDYYAKK